MTIPDKLRSLFALGAFCVLGSTWLALATGFRTQPIREARTFSAAPDCTNEGVIPSRTSQDFCAAPAP